MVNWIQLGIVILPSCNIVSNDFSRRAELEVQSSKMSYFR